METKVGHLKSVERTSFLFYVWLVLLAGAMYPMGYSVGRYVLNGTPIIDEYIGSSVPWGLLVPVYIFFVVSSTGLCLVSSFGHVFKFKNYEVVSTRGIFLAIVMILTGFLAISLDLGRLDRGYYPFLVAQNFSSPMLWMIMFYVVYLLCIAIEFWFLVRRELAEKIHESHGVTGLFYKLLTLTRVNTSDEAKKTDMKLAQIAGVAGVISGVTAHSNLGALLGLVKARPFWYGPLMPVYFIISALVSGAAIITFVTIVTYKVTGKEITHEIRQAVIDYGKVLGLLIVVQLFVMAWKMMTTAYSLIPQTHEAETLLLTGSFSLPFWGLEILVGSIIPFFILLFPKTGRSIWGVLAASFMAILGIFAMRYDMVIVGQIVPSLDGSYGFYTPSSTEISILIGLVALSAFIYTVGQKIFPLSEH